MVLTYFLLFLSLFQASLALGNEPRQSSSAATTDFTACTNYARTANLSVVGLNSTYRAAFLRSAPMGVSFAATILDKGIAALPALQTDTKLNEQCGNFTTTSAQDAAANFTQGTVLGIKIEDAVGASVDSVAMPVSWALIALLMGGTFYSL